MRRVMCAVLILAICLLAVDVGAGQPPAKNKTDPKMKTDPKADPAPAFNMKVTVKDIVLGQHITGPKIEVGDLKSRVVLVDEWGIHCPPCLAAMPHTADLNAELADFGLVIIGSHRQDGNADQVRAVATSHRANFTINQQTIVRGTQDNNLLPHCILFDHTGACIFRGLPTEVEPLIRKAVGAALVAAAGREKFSSSLEPIIKELKAGKPPLTILPKVASMRSFTGDAGADASALLGAMTAGGRKKLELATEKKDSDPVEAYTMIEKLPAAYKGSPLAQEANELLNKLKGEKAVKAELAARQYMENVRKLDQQLGLGADDPRKPEWQKAHAPVLKQLKDKVAQMKKVWPDAHATKEALEIADRYALEIK
jgi:thiol-disulfide isomerase/thioredoxin